MYTPLSSDGGLSSAFATNTQSLQRLKDKVSLVNSLEEATAFTLQIDYLRSVIERSQNREEKLQFFKQRSSQLIDLFIQQLSSWNPTTTPRNSSSTIHSEARDARLFETAQALHKALSFSPESIVWESLDHSASSFSEDFETRSECSEDIDSPRVESIPKFDGTSPRPLSREESSDDISRGSKTMRTRMSRLSFFGGKRDKGEEASPSTSPNIYASSPPSSSSGFFSKRGTMRTSDRNSIEETMISFVNGLIEFLSNSSGDIKRTESDTKLSDKKWVPSLGSPDSSGSYSPPSNSPTMGRKGSFIDPSSNGSSPNSPRTGSSRDFSNSLTWGQLLAKLKDQIPVQTKERLERLIVQRGLINTPLPSAKKQTYFKINSAESKLQKEEDKKTKKFKADLVKGKYDKKGKQGAFQPDEIDFLLDTALQKEAEPEAAKMALIALAAASYPKETVAGIRNKILNAGFLRDLVQMAITDQIVVHNEISKNETEMIKLIAEGASAKVYSAKWKGKEVAMKRFEVAHISFDTEEFKKEIAMMSLIQSDSLTTFFGACTSSDAPFIVSEMVTGTLSQFLADCGPFLDFKGKVDLCWKISKGMSFLHSLSVIHRDLKPHNIMVDSSFKCKIIDLGSSGVVDAEKAMTDRLGTPMWMAPEVLKAASYTEKADVYSFAIIMWEMWTIKEPFSGLQIFEIPDAVVAGKRPEIPKDMHQDYSRVMQLCWEDDPVKRPSFFELVNYFDWMKEKFNADDYSSSSAKPPPL